MEITILYELIKIFSMLKEEKVTSIKKESRLSGKSLVGGGVVVSLLISKMPVWAVVFLVLSILVVVLTAVFRITDKKSNSVELVRAWKTPNSSIGEVEVK